MKRLFSVLSCLALPFFYCLSGAASSANLKNPNEIIKKSLDYATSIDSYICTVKGEGWDMNAAQNAQRTASVASEAASKYGDIAKNVEQDAAKNQKPIYKRYVTENKFKKPYLLQMRIIMSEYVPAILYGGLMTYRPDKDPNVFWFKPKISPIAIKRDATGESGDLFYNVMPVLYAQMEILNKNGKPTFKGATKVNGKEAYVVEWAFKKNQKLKEYPVDFKKWGVPKQAQEKFGGEANAFAKQPAGRVVFYFDKNSMLVAARETYNFDNQLLGKKEWLDIKVNGLAESDF